MVAGRSRASAGVVAALASGPTLIPLDIGGHGVQQGANPAEAGAKSLEPPGAIPAAFCARFMRRKRVVWMERSEIRERLIGCQKFRCAPTGLLAYRESQRWVTALRA